jgi:hypothetical protein
LLLSVTCALLRATAAAARQLGMEPHLILRTNTAPADLSLTGDGSSVSSLLSPALCSLIGNLLVDRMVGSQIRTVSPSQSFPCRPHSPESQRSMPRQGAINSSLSSRRSYGQRERTRTPFLSADRMFKSEAALSASCADHLSLSASLRLGNLWLFASRPGDNLELL